MFLNMLKKNILFLSISSLITVSNSPIVAMRLNEAGSQDTEGLVELSRAHPQMRSVGYVLAPYGVGSGTLVDKRLSTMKYYEDKTPNPTDLALTCAHNFGPFLAHKKQELLQRLEEEKTNFMSFNLENDEFFMGFDDICDIENPQDRVRILEAFLPCDYIASYFKHGGTSSITYNFDFAFVKLEKEMTDRPALFIFFQPCVSEGLFKDFIGMGYGNEKREKRAACFYDPISQPSFKESNLIFNQNVFCEPGDSGGPVVVSTNKRNDLFIGGMIVAAGEVGEDNIKLFEQTPYRAGEKEHDLYSAILPLPTMQPSLRSFETRETFLRMFEAAGGKYYSVMCNMIEFLKQRAASKNPN